MAEPTEEPTMCAMSKIPLEYTPPSSMESPLLPIDCVVIIFDFYILHLGDFRNLVMAARRSQKYHIGIVNFAGVCHDWYIVSTHRRSYAIYDNSQPWSKRLGNVERVPNLLHKILSPNRGVYRLQITSGYWSIKQNTCLLKILELSATSLHSVNLSLSLDDESNLAGMAAPDSMEDIAFCCTKRMYPALHLLQSLGRAQKLEALELQLFEQLPLEVYIKYLETLL